MVIVRTYHGRDLHRMHAASCCASGSDTDDDAFDLKDLRRFGTGLVAFQLRLGASPTANIATQDGRTRGIPAEVVEGLSTEAIAT